MTHHGAPCWYELATAPGHLGAAGDFYAQVLGWTVADAGMPGFTYHLASAGADRVAGLMDMPPDVTGMPPFWLIYFAVTDADATAAAVTRAGGKVHRPVAAIPGTGRFAILADPQGVGFGILEPAPMESGPQQGSAFDQQRDGHGNWNELATTDPAAAMAFYGAIFGWTKTRAMDMGQAGTYDTFAWNGTDVGGMMRKAPAIPGPGHWLPYFGTQGVEAAISRITAAGGSVIHGPQDVPNGAVIAVATDPQGAHFAVVGPK
jgi:predicted enzyme related to lactoylglutathione lyase